ncbi:MAG: hypothetical protein AVDCRST_MAG20-1022, partial [uncultured Acidimicrobiales bacterium]
EGPLGQARRAARHRVLPGRAVPGVPRLERCGDLRPGLGPAAVPDLRRGRRAVPRRHRRQHHRGVERPGRCRRTRGERGRAAGVGRPDVSGRPARRHRFPVGGGHGRRTAGRPARPGGGRTHLVPPARLPAGRGAGRGGGDHRRRRRRDRAHPLPGVQPRHRRPGRRPGL